MLEVGQKVPEFSLPDSDGKLVRLSAQIGKKVVVYFYPKDDTPGCTLEAIDFSKKLPEFTAANAVVFGVSKDSKESHQKFCHKHSLGVRLLSDTNGEVVEAWGIWQEKKNYGKTYMGIVRTTVLIDEKGVVQKVWKNVKVDGHVDTVLNAVKAL